MCSLLDRLCVLLQCAPKNLADAMADVENFPKIYAELSKCRLKTTHLKENRYISFGAVSFQGANRQYAYRGYLGVTVQQHMYSKHRLMLRYPMLPCIEEHANAGHVNYYPIECLYWEACDY